MEEAMPTGQQPVRREEQRGKPSVLFDISPQVPSCQWAFCAFSISAELGFSEPVSALTSILPISGLRTAVSLPQSWRMVMTQQLMTPTCPITTWSPLRQTFWTESPWGPLSSPQLLVLLLFTR